MNCTWKDCERPAAHPQIGQDGKEWANLCDEHHTEMEEGLRTLEPRRVVRDWVNAQGGARKAADRVAPEVVEAVQVFASAVARLGEGRSNVKRPGL